MNKRENNWWIKYWEAHKKELMQKKKDHVKNFINEYGVSYRQFNKEFARMDENKLRFVVSKVLNQLASGDND